MTQEAATTDLDNDTQDDHNGEIREKDVQQEGFRLSFKDIAVKVGKHKLLDDIFGWAKDGTVTAILGPSGSGKTTLLNALAGRIRLENGEILANGGKYTKTIRRTVNYVEQEDLFFTDLTLWETLMFRAMFVLPSAMTYQQKKDRVEEVIDILDLQKCKNTVIGSQFVQGLSGGEKKRTSIACELISNPNAILLDEPTSGLDSTIAFELIRTICTYAKRYNKTIILTIHQPSSQIFYAFDKVLLLYDGKMGYFGGVHHVMDHVERIGLPCMEHYNPADHLLDLAKSKDKLTISKLESGVPLLKQEEMEGLTGDPEKVLDNQVDGEVAYEQVTFGAVQELHDCKSKWQSSFFIQVLALFVRELKYALKVVYDVKVVVANIIYTLMFPIVAFQIGRSEEMMNNVTGVIFSLVVYLYFSSIRDELFLHQMEKDIVYRERATGLYRLSSYVTAKFLILVLVRPGLPLLVWSGTYWFTLADGFVKYLVSVLIVYYIKIVYSSLNKLIVVVGDNQSTVTSLTTITGLSSFLTTGYWVRTVPVWMGWAMYVLPLRYGHNALLATIITPETIITCRQNGTSVYTGCTAGADNVTAVEYLRAETIFPSPVINIGILTLYLVILWGLIVLVLRVFRTPKH